MMSNFFKEETGAITVDWVVLTAALVGLGLAVMTVVGDGVNSSTNAVADEMADDETIMAAANVGRNSGDLGDWSGTGFDSAAHWGADQLHDDSEAFLVGLINQFESGAANSTFSSNDRAINADAYGQVYSELESRGHDVSGYTDPADVNQTIG